MKIIINADRNRVAKRLLVNTPKPKAKSREYFIRLAREHANIGGWYDESICRNYRAGYQRQPFVPITFQDLIERQSELMYTTKQ